MRKAGAQEQHGLTFWIRAESKKKVDKLPCLWGEDAAKRCIPVVSVIWPSPSVCTPMTAKLKGKIKHFFHLAAVSRHDRERRGQSHC